MSEPVFVIQNQHGFYLTRQNEWNDGHDAAALFKAAHRDIALNTLIEMNAKDIELRGNIISVPVNEKGVPQVTPCDAISAANDDANDARMTDVSGTSSDVSADSADESQCLTDQN